MWTAVAKLGGAGAFRTADISKLNETVDELRLGIFSSIFFTFCKNPILMTSDYEHTTEYYAKYGEMNLKSPSVFSVVGLYVFRHH